MMFYVNKVVWFFVQPLTIGLFLVLAGMFLLAKNKRKHALGAFAAAVAVLYFFSTFTAVCLLGIPLENTYRNCESAESEVEGAVGVDCALNSCLCLNVVCGANDGHTGQ